jgi:hypothetical protein
MLLRRRKRGREGLRLPHLRRPGPAERRNVRRDRRRSRPSGVLSRGHRKRRRGNPLMADPLRGRPRKGKSLRDKRRSGRPTRNSRKPGNPLRLNRPNRVPSLLPHPRLPLLPRLQPPYPWRSLQRSNRSPSGSLRS